MNRRFGLRFALAVAAGALATNGLAQERSGRGEQDAAAGKAMADNKASLQKAVSAAESAGKGMALMAVVRGAKEDWKINVQVWSGNQRVSVPVDLKTGKAGDAAAGRADAPGGDRDKKLAEALSASKVKLSDAIAAAEAHSKGSAFRAMAMDAGGNLTFQVNCWADGKVMLCKVDGKTREVTEEKNREDRREERKAGREKKGKKGDKGESAPPPKP